MRGIPANFVLEATGKADHLGMEFARWVQKIMKRKKGLMHCYSNCGSQTGIGSQWVVTSIWQGKIQKMEVYVCKILLQTHNILSDETYNKLVPYILYVFGDF